MPIFDALLNSKQIKFVLTRHEQGATHMADGYARATSKPGVALVTSRPWSNQHDYWAPNGSDGFVSHNRPYGPDHNLNARQRCLSRSRRIRHFYARR